ncbi:MAG: hypothetical protein AAGI08_04615 [Bacteroidota bacterium]
MANPVLLRIAFWVGVLGFVASLFVHLATFTDYAPPGAAVVLHVGIFVAFVPVVFAMKAWVEERGYDFSDFRSQWAFQKELFGLLPGWQKLALPVLMAYTAINFSVGVAAVTGDPDAGSSFRLLSGHWLSFYFVSAVLARRFLSLSQPVVPPHE